MCRIEDESGYLLAVVSDTWVLRRVLPRSVLDSTDVFINNAVSVISKRCKPGACLFSGAGGVARETMHYRRVFFPSLPRKWEDSGYVVPKRGFKTL